MTYAIVLRETGGPEKLRLDPGELRVRHTAIGVEAAGVVEDLGAGVTGFSPGDRIGYIDDRYGANVIATVGSSAKAKVARECGADHVILYREESFVERVRELTEACGCLWRALPHTRKLVSIGVGSVLKGWLDDVDSNPPDLRAIHHIP